MPSDAKKKRDLQKKTAAKQRQAQGKKSNTTNGQNPTTDPIDDENLDENEENEDQNENENPMKETTTTTTTTTTNDIDPNVKSLIQNLDLLSMVEKANAAARSCTGNK